MTLRAGAKLMLASVSLAVTTPACAGGYSQLYAFGDSYVDAGNYLAVAGFPRPPAFEGRFSNGYNYADLISMDLFGHALTPSLAGGTDYAYGGALVVFNSASPRNLKGQLKTFAKSLGDGAADPNGLYLLDFGAHFAGFAVEEPVLIYGTKEAYVQAKAVAYAGAIKTLNDLGARNFIIANAPIITATAREVADANEVLDLALDNLTLAAGSSVFRLEHAAFLAQVAADPTALGLSGPLQTGGSCGSAGVKATAECDNYVSYDGVHYSAAANRALANYAKQQFGLTALAVPEPLQWAWMICGMALIGLTRRWGRRAVRVAVR